MHGDEFRYYMNFSGNKNFNYENISSSIIGSNYKKEELYIDIFNRIGYTQLANVLYEIKNNVRQFRSSADRSFYAAAVQNRFGEKIEIKNFEEILYGKDFSDNKVLESADEKTEADEQLNKEFISNYNSNIFIKNPKIYMCVLF